MKQSIFSQSAPWILAVVLLASYASFTLGVPAVAALFADFKMELSAPTMLAINLANFADVRTMPLIFVLAGIPFILGKQRKWTWLVGFVWTLVFSFGLLASMLPFLTILDALRDNNKPQNMLASSPQIVIAMFIVFLPPLLFLALRRAFCQQQPRRDSLPQL